MGGHFGYVLAFFNIWERYYWVIIGAMSWLSSIFGSVLNGWSLGLCPGFLQYLGAFLMGGHWSDVMAVCTI